MSDQICYGCLDHVWVEYKDSGFKLTESSLKRIQSLCRIRDIKFVLVRVAAEKYKLNIYGPEAELDGLKTLLTDYDMYLKHPTMVEKGVDYKNPRYYHYPGCDTSLLSHVPTEWDGVSPQEVQSWSATEIEEQAKQSAPRKAWWQKHKS